MTPDFLDGMAAACLAMREAGWARLERQPHFEHDRTAGSALINFASELEEQHGLPYGIYWLREWQRLRLDPATRADATAIVNRMRQEHRERDAG